jgi:hypothetical protein
MTDIHDPYGLKELDRKLTRRGDFIKCPVRGCCQWLMPPSRRPKFAGEPCPTHGVVTHRSGTYSYRDYRRNLIVGAAFFDQHIRHHPFKYEAHRFGSEKSEDALTWNVLRSLQHAQALDEVAALVLGHRFRTEPRLFLWGLEIMSDSVRPWDLLIAARERFESDLPVNRPCTEPDAALFLPGQYLILIEAKFTSGNPVYRRDRNKLLDLTLDQLIHIYQDPSLHYLNYEEACQREAVHYQLWRNLIFAEYMATLDSPQTIAAVVNLVREGTEHDTCWPVVSLMNEPYRHRFEQVTWEDLYVIARRTGAIDIAQYMQNKTAGLKPAFSLDNFLDTP